MLRVLALTLPLTFALMVVAGGTVSAQPVIADPEDLAITPSELPPGFTYDPSTTAREDLNDGIGTGYKVALEREPTPEHLASGPIAISQVIFRIDRLIVPADFFTEVRDRVAREQELQPVPGAPSSPTTAFLMKRGARDDQAVVLYGIGNVQDNFVFFTFIGGPESATTLDAAIQIAKLSTDKYEALKSAPPEVQAEHLYRALLRAPFLAPNLADPFGTPRVSSGEPGGRAVSHGVVGAVDVDFDDGTTIGNLTFLVYPSDVEAQAAFEEARSRPRGTILGEFSPADLPVPFFCVNSVGPMDGRPMGVSACLALLGNVEIGAITALPSARAGDEAGTGELLRTGLQHLQRLRH